MQSERNVPPTLKKNGLGVGVFARNRTHVSRVRTKSASVPLIVSVDGTFDAFDQLIAEIAEFFLGFLREIFVTLPFDTEIVDFWTRQTVRSEQGIEPFQSLVEHRKREGIRRRAWERVVYSVQSILQDAFLFANVGVEGDRRVGPANLRLFLTNLLLPFAKLSVQIARCWFLALDFTENFIWRDRLGGWESG